MPPRCSASSINRDGEQICAEVFGGRMAFVPYVMPGFGLAKKAVEVFERAPKRATD